MKNGRLNLSSKRHGFVSDEYLDTGLHSWGLRSCIASEIPIQTKSGVGKMMNMRQVLPVSLTVLSLSAVCGTAMAEGYPKELEKDLISVCRNAAEDDRSGLRQAVRELTPSSRINTSTYKVLANGLVCNGMQLAAFARYYGASDTYTLLKKYTYPNAIIEIKDVTASRDVPVEISVSMTTGK